MASGALLATTSVSFFTTGNTNLTNRCQRYTLAVPCFAAPSQAGRRIAYGLLLTVLNLFRTIR